MANINTRIQESYHLLSEIDPKKGLNIADAQGQSEIVPFSHATKGQLTRLQQHLGSNSNEVTPMFKEDGGMAVLMSLEVGREFQTGEAAAKLVKLTGRQAHSLPAQMFGTEDIARITSRPVEQSFTSIV